VAKSLGKELGQREVLLGCLSSEKDTDEIKFKSLKTHAGAWSLHKLRHHPRLIGRRSFVLVNGFHIDFIMLGANLFRPCTLYEG
jgi:hypothetical protein